MDRDPLWLLRDAKHGADVALRITAALTLQTPTADELVRAAAGRPFGIPGEAPKRLGRADPVLAARGPGLHRAIAFRDILIDGGGAVDDATVRRTTERDPPDLLQHIDALIAGRGAS